MLNGSRNLELCKRQFTIRSFRSKNNTGGDFWCARITELDKKYGFKREFLEKLYSEETDEWENALVISVYASRKGVYEYKNIGDGNGNAVSGFFFFERKKDENGIKGPPIVTEIDKKDVESYLS